MKTHKLTFNLNLSVRQRIVAVVVAAVMVVSVPLSVAQADTFDEQIRALQAEVNGFQTQAAQFRAQANTLQAQLNALGAEARALQVQIDLNNAKLAQTNAQIAETERKIAEQKEVLSDNLVSLYLDSTVTPLEAFASSSSISDFIDKQEYRETVRQELQNSIATVKELKENLDKQKKELENTIADQKVRNDALAAKQNEAANLLAQTQGQEAAYQQIASQKNSQIATLRAQQAAANLKWGGNVNYSPRGGGYPSYWADIPMDSTIDDWLMYNRECVSYTAFRVGASGRYQPTGFGNANQWPGYARARGIPVDSNPRVGDVAVWPVGYYGHVMYVEGVAPDGSIYISEYNFDWTGRYSERSISSSTWRSQGFVFIHF
ncbi:MAG TPA: CHAP domain-containing protein [Candidatus Saccharimonadales bacterium]|nr:CHAP domain-containing protein [Candidatus Saccharimonadales bacterium]